MNVSGRSSVVSVPLEFSQLAAATDLREAPRNWLQGDAIPRDPGRPQTAHEGFLPSVAKANGCLERVAKVDVITDTENVKKLLKMAYDGPTTSMLVHRVGRTLLIDAFDSPRTLLRMQEDDWPWMQSFMRGVLTESPGARAPLAIGPRDMEERLMLSKFLYHSIADSGPPALMERRRSTSGGLRETLVPDPGEETDSFGRQRSASTSGGPEREVLWTFEDITMLLGTNLPIFGCGTHPCVTLKLRDMDKPINVLTGLDYWLDQLMCNVPEVAMCYHLEGIVQKYEIVATEDLPDLPGSSFDPEVVKSLAGNLLGFLKDNATKEGHTYWLFKAKDDEVVKLYDLSSLCTSLGHSADANPFTVPVGMLMYRVGRSLLREAAEVKSAPARGLFNTVYRLLNSALRLLNRDLHPQVVGSCHYLLANLYLAYGTSGSAAPGKEEEETPIGWELEEEGWEESKQGEASSWISTDVLRYASSERRQAGETASGPAPKRPLPNSTNLDDCCKQALEHVFDGLDCAETFERKPAEKTEEQEQGAAPRDPAQPIPMSFTAPSSQLQRRGFPVGGPAWQNELRCVLLIQAAGAYRLLSESSSRLGNLGRALRHAQAAFLCLEGVRAALSSAPTPASRTLKRCGELSRGLLPHCLAHTADVFLLLAKGEPCINGEKIRRELSQEPHFRDAKILSRARKMLDCEDDQTGFFWATEAPGPGDAVPLLRAKECYEAALKELRRDVPESSAQFLRFTIGSPWPGRVELLRRLGNALNELGMVQTRRLTAALSEESDSSDSELGDLAASALGFFQDGIGRFTEAADAPNVALLLSNCGRIARIQSRQLMQPGKEFTPAEKRALQKAIDFYQRAMDVLSGESRLRPSRRGPNDCEAAGSIGAVVTSELAGTYFTLASQLQERPPLSRATVPEVEREICELMQSALRQYELVLSDWGGSPLGPRALHRAFLIHHRLASLHHKAYREREEPSSRKAKASRAAAEASYAAGVAAFQRLPPEERTPSLLLSLLRLQLERVALLEFRLTGTTEASPAWKEALLAEALGLLGDGCRAAWAAVAAALKEEPEKRDEEEESAELAGEVETVGRLWLERAQAISKATLQFALDQGQKSANVDERKAAYKATLVKVDWDKWQTAPAKLSIVAGLLKRLTQK